MPLHHGGRGPRHLSRWPKAAFSGPSDLDELIELLTDGGYPTRFALPAVSDMFQDNARTTPAVAHNDPVAAIQCLVTGEWTEVSATDRRPLLQLSTGLPRLKFDGSNDCLVWPSVDFSAVNKAIACVGVNWAANGSQMAIELGANSGTSTGLALHHPSTANTLGAIQRSSTVSAVIISSAASYAPPIKVVQSGVFDTTTGEVKLRVNGDEVATNSTTTGGVFGNLALNVGARNAGAGAALNGEIHGNLLTGTNDPAILALVESVMAQYSGVTL